MAQADGVVANGSGAAVRSDLNNQLAAIFTNHSGSTEPSTTYAYQWWADTNANVLKIRNSANNAWITLRELDGTMLIEDGSASTPGLAFADDVNTGIFSPAADQIGFATGGAERLEIGSSEVVFNDPSNDVDFRVESNGNTHMLFVDAGNDAVGIGTSGPADYSSSADDLVIAGSGQRGITIASTDSNQSNIFFADATSGSGESAGYLAYIHSSDALAFGANGSEQMRIDSSGRLLVGTNADKSISSDANALVQIFTSSAGKLLIGRSDASVVADDFLGVIDFHTFDGGSQRGARIAAKADGDHASGDVPSRIEFSTCADGSSTLTERMRITNAGALKASTSGSFVTTGTTHELTGSATSTPVATVYEANTSFADHAVRIAVQRSASQSYNFALIDSGGLGGDTEYRLRGDGSAFADGDWNTGGADYAEYFEWSDGNASSEDRRGISVVLVDDKIREAVAGEDPIGVISGNPSVVGDAAWNKWSGKHLRDDYGSYVLDANGDRQLNPDYDPDLTYVPREDRAEWDCVGLMGKLRIRKGQVTGSRWIKMRDVSATVEEWLVR